MTRYRKRTLWITAVMLLLLMAGVLVYYSITAGLTVPTNPRVQADILILNTQLRVYKGITGSYPTTEQGFDALITRPTTPPIPTSWRQLLNETVVDPWGNPYVYRFPSAADPTTFEVFSLGPDRVESRDDIRAPQNSLSR